MNAILESFKTQEEAEIYVLIFLWERGPYSDPSDTLPHQNLE